MNKIISIILSFLLLSIGFTTVTTIAESSTILLNSKNKIYVGGSGPGNYTSIQTAINDVSPGGTVYVYNGTYYEHHIIIEKKICLLGENKSSTIINVVGKHQGIQIYYDEVFVKGFTIRNNSYAFDWWCNSLLEVNKSKNVRIEDNIFINDYVNPLKDNYICGICLLQSRGCILRNNSFYGCSLVIFYFDHFDTEDSGLRYFIHDVDTSNTVNGKPVYYYKNCENVIVPSNAGQVIFININNSKISGYKGFNTALNIQLIHSNDNIIENIKINNSLSGIWLHYSNYNTFTNISVNSTACSLFLWQSKYNTFQNNILPSITLEQHSDHNVFIKNHIPSGRNFKFSLQLETSDFNVFKCNNIYGRNFIVGMITKENKSVQLWDSHFTIWDKNYWGDCLREKNKYVTKYFPKIIVGLHRGIYVRFPKINFPSIINFDWHPAIEPYEI